MRSGLSSVHPLDSEKILPNDLPHSWYTTRVIDFRTILQEDYNLPAEKTDQVLSWLQTRPRVEHSMFLGRLAGWSLSMIADDIGVGKTTVHDTISRWDGLREILTVGADAGA